MRVRPIRQLVRRWPVALAFVLISFVLPGCIQVEFSSVFEREGVAVHTLSVSVSREQFQAAEERGETDAFADISSSAADAGLTASRIITSDTVTLRISTERPDGEDSGAALNSLLNATGINQEPGISAPFSGAFRQEGAAVGGSNFLLDMIVDGELLYDAAASTDLAAGETRERIEENVSIRYVVLVPGDLVSTTGQEIEPGAIRWDVGPNETVSAVAETSASDPSRSVLFVVAAIGLAIAAVSLAALIGWILVRRPALATTIASAAAHFPRRTTITREGVWVADRVRQVVERIWHRGAPDHSSPVRHDLLESETEGGEDGTDTEGDRPAAGVHRG